MAAVTGGGAYATEYIRTYTSFSGCDIVCTFGNTVIGELQALTYSVQREKAPIYTMGSAEPRSFSRGKRGIAGTLVFTVFDRDALINALKDKVKEGKTFHRILGNQNMQAMTIEQWDAKASDTISGAVGNNNASSTGSEVDAVGITNALTSADAEVYYADEIPPFDVTVSFANEYGQRAYLVIYGVEILNEGTQLSIDNVTTEKACTFVARKVDYLKPLNDDSKVVSGTNKNATEITSSGVGATV